MSFKVEGGLKLWTNCDVSPIARTILLAESPLQIEDQIFSSPESESADALAEIAGRVCYMSYGKGRSSTQYMDNILKSKHGSVLEHASVSFLLQGVSRSLTHELVRHRAGFGYSQLSQRYVDESQVGFVVPPELPASCKYHWEESCNEALLTYRFLVKTMTAEYQGPLTGTDLRKTVRQTARSVLPNCTETKLVVTANMRAWRHFIEVRGSLGADIEIRRLAWTVAGCLKEIAPLTFADVRCSKDGDYKVECDYSKV